MRIRDTQRRRSQAEVSERYAIKHLIAAYYFTSKSLFNAHWHPILHNNGFLGLEKQKK